MTVDIGLLLLILVTTLVLFSFEWVPVDIVAIGVVLALILTGLLPVDLALAGYGSETVVMILGLLILTAMLVRTGVVERMGRLLLRHTSENPGQLSLIVMLAAGSLSAFMSNTAATAFFAPMVLGIARRLRVSASRLLMPLAFSSILAGSVTLIGTSTNIVVSGLMAQYGLPPMGMFELTPVGIPILIVGWLYMVFIGQRLIPDRESPQELTDEFDLRPYLAEVSVIPTSSLIGKTLAESGLGRDMDITVLRIQRGDHQYMAPQGEVRLEGGDTLVVEGLRDQIVRLKDSVGFGIRDGEVIHDPDLQTPGAQLAEVVLLPGSPLIGRRLIGVDLRDQYGLQVLAINRHEGVIHQRLSDIPLRLGDVLLVQGSPTNLATLAKNNIFRVIGIIEGSANTTRRGWIAISVFAGVILLATFNLVSLPVAVMIGALAAFLTRCVTPEEAYRDVEWRVVILIGSMLAFGQAMEVTGTADYLASLIASIAGEANPLWLLSGFFFLTVILTQPMSNQAAAVVVLPVAMQTAVRLGLNPRSVAMMIALAASTSYITPLEPACLIVYGLGRYRFLDFLKVGSLLTVLVFLVAITLVPMIWPLH
jgi:di/tricarboxylate transporter